MRTLLIVVLGAVLGLLVQTTLSRVLPQGWGGPDVLLVLCVYLGLNRHSVGGAVGAFTLGYLQDSVSGTLPGVNAFAMSLVFCVVYLTSRHLWVDNVSSRVVVVLFAGLVKVSAVWAVVAFLGSLEVPLRSLAPALAAQVVMAALIAPPMFAFLDRTRWREEAATS